MEVKTSKTDNANVKIEAKIDKKEIENKSEKIAKQLAKTMDMPGFRKGKVPVAIVKKKYGQKLTQDAESQLFQEALNKGIEEAGIKKDELLGEPKFEEFNRTEEAIEAVITVSFRPQIDIEGYEEVVPDFEEPEVTEEEVEERIKQLVESAAPLKKVEEDRPLQEGDTAVIDFKGYVEGKELEGGSAQNFSLKIGSGQFIEGFEEQLIGMKPGETKTIEVTFPEDYHNKDIAGKPAKFDVTLKEIRVKEDVELDDELAKKLLNEEDATVEKLREKVREELKSAKLSKLYNEELKPKLIEALVEKFEFDLPKNIVEQEIDLHLRKKLQNMTEEELKELRENEDKIKELRDSFKEEAQRSVKATFIVDALAKAEKIEVNDQEVIQTIYFEAMQMGENPQEILEMYQKQGLIPAIKMAMIEDKLLTALLNKKMEQK
ncbi:trigger factor [Nitrosophilus alvini]|uniref:trigger factor n=1 Tax=Nitrosophilus alvini TaxID=2714855 RepID=UPI00190B3674|nr:trigger factor [Nitrosophilus alvini]